MHCVEHDQRCLASPKHLPPRATTTCRYIQGRSCLVEARTAAAAALSCRPFSPLLSKPPLSTRHQPPPPRARPAGTRRYLRASGSCLSQTTAHFTQVSCASSFAPKPSHLTQFLNFLLASRLSPRPGACSTVVVIRFVAVVASGAPSPAACPTWTFACHAQKIAPTHHTQTRRRPLHRQPTTSHPRILPPTTALPATNPLTREPPHTAQSGAATSPFTPA